MTEEWRKIISNCYNELQACESVDEVPKIIISYLYNSYAVDGQYHYYDQVAMGSEGNSIQGVGVHDTVGPQTLGSQHGQGGHQWTHQGSYPRPLTMFDFCQQISKCRWCRFKKLLNKCDKIPRIRWTDEQINCLKKLYHCEDAVIIYVKEAISNPNSVGNTMVQESAVNLSGFENNEPTPDPLDFGENQKNETMPIAINELIMNTSQSALINVQVEHVEETKAKADTIAEAFPTVSQQHSIEMSSSIELTEFTAEQMVNNSINPTIDSNEINVEAHEPVNKPRVEPYSVKYKDITAGKMMTKQFECTCKTKNHNNLSYDVLSKRAKQIVDEDLNSLCLLKCKKFYFPETYREV